MAFVLDTFLGWVFRTVASAADAEMNDDTTLREQLLEAEMRREMGEISDDEFAEFEADVLQRIREIKERREGGSGPLAFGPGEALESTPDSQFQIEATISGDFHEPEEVHVESANLVPPAGDAEAPTPTPRPRPAAAAGRAPTTRTRPAAGRSRAKRRPRTRKPS